jgi:hypothetical protein
MVGYCVYTAGCNSNKQHSLMRTGVGSIMAASLLLPPKVRSHNNLQSPLVGFLMVSSIGFA